MPSLEGAYHKGEATDTRFPSLVVYEGHMSLDHLLNNWKVASQIIGALGLVWGAFKAYSGVIDWATNLKDNHLHSIETNTGKLLDKTEEQTRVLVGMSAKIDTLTDVIARKL